MPTMYTFMKRNILPVTYVSSMHLLLITVHTFKNCLLFAHNYFGYLHEKDLVVEERNGTQNMSYTVFLVYYKMLYCNVNIHVVLK